MLPLSTIDINFLKVYNFYMFGKKKFYKINSETLNLKDFELLWENGMDINILWQKKSEKISELESQLKKAVVTVKNLQGELTELKENGIVMLNSDEVVITDSRDEKITFLENKMKELETENVELKNNVKPFSKTDNITLQNQLKELEFKYSNLILEQTKAQAELNKIKTKNILQKDNKSMNNEVTQWEYKILDGSLSSYETREKEINELGKNGWELIGVDPTHPTEFLFKRGKKDLATDYNYSR